MEERRSVTAWKGKVDPVLVSKVDELRLLGYEKATKQELWECLIQKVWKGVPEKRVYEVVQEILHMNSHVFLSYLTKEAYKDDDLSASIKAVSSSDEMKENR